MWIGKFPDQQFDWDARGCGRQRGGLKFKLKHVVQCTVIYTTTTDYKLNKIISSLIISLIGSYWPCI